MRQIQKELGIEKDRNAAFFFQTFELGLLGV